MKIREVAISGYRSLWDVSITELGDDINIFFGDNNSGKSNILEALETLFKVERRDLPVSGFIQGELTNFIDNFTMRPDGNMANSISMKCKVAIANEDYDKISQFIEFLKKNKIFKTPHKQWLELEVEIKPITSIIANRILKKASINENIMYDSSLTPPRNFFPALNNEISQDEKENATGVLFEYLINAFSKIHTGRLMENNKEWFRSLVESRGENYKTFQKIQKLFKEKPFEYGNIRPIIVGDKADLVVEDTFGRELMVERLGTGVQQILVLLSQIAARVSKSKTKILGIEELELNLSPDMQMIVLDMLKKMAGETVNSGISQIFLTSHSPYLCKRDCPDLYAVTIDGTHGTKVQHGPTATQKLIKHYNYDLFK